MKPSPAVRTVLLTLALATAGCGEDNNPPVQGGPSPFAPQVSGFWSGTLALDTASGGECVGADPSVFIPAVQDVTGVISQTGSDLTARLTSAATGLACSYTGRSTFNDLVLDASACDAASLIVQCANGAARELRLAGSSVTATLQGGAVVGRAAATYNVFDPVTGFGVGGLQVTYNLTATRR